MQLDHTQFHMPHTIAANPFIKRLLAGIPDDIRDSFSPAQLAALARSVQPPATRHMIDYRVSVPLLFGGRYYLVFLFGRERRNMARLNDEGQTHATRLAILYSLLMATLGGLLLFGMFCALYLLKSYSGVNLFDGESPLHPLYLLLRQP